MTNFSRSAALVLYIAGSLWLTPAEAQRSQRDWPAVVAETKPWTRWWWQGSAVDRASLTADLKALAGAGIGGVEVTPIYGVYGAEDRFIRYLSPEWMAMLNYTLREATRLNMGVDMATGTGWPFGGPWVDDDTAARSIAHKTWMVDGGHRLAEPVRLRQAPLVSAISSYLQVSDLAEPLTANRDLQSLALEQVKFARDLPLVVLMGYSDGGDSVDLTSHVQPDRKLDWTAPPGRWTLYALFAAWHGKLVERAAPGGEGFVIDHFSAEAIRKYLRQFDRAFGGNSLRGLRAFFNDSYEVDDAAGEADWTPLLFDEFKTRRGYDLRSQLPALLVGAGTSDVGARVLADYRETISDLLLDTFTAEWSAWARRHGRQVRNQAHGSPASLLDLYAASDIPETEGTEMHRFKWATSAAHVAGRRLVSAEAATWLGEHFRVRLAEVRAAVDQFFVAGVNHIVYHGTAYSPVGDQWPGWQFYASVEFNPRNAWWDDFSTLNAYVARVQSFLQSGRPDTDVLLYYPFYESLTVPGKSRLAHYGGAAPPAQGTAFERAASVLQSAGFTYDFISDRQVHRLLTEKGHLTTEGGASYRTIVLPSCRYIPLDTFLKMLELARTGATVVSFENWPADVSGLADLDIRRTKLKEAIEAVNLDITDADNIREVAIGNGRLLQGRNLGRLLARADVHRESLVDQGLQFARRVDRMGRIYFVSNPGEQPLDGWVPLQIRAEDVMAFDPMNGRRGRVTTRTNESSREVYLQIPPGSSLIVAESPGRANADFDSYRIAGEPVELTGPWTLRFLKGGPTLPSQRRIDQLVSWTTLDHDGEMFSGTGTYTTTFATPTAGAQWWRLDLGAVAESARVRLNGRDLATLIQPPFRVVIDRSQMRSNNTLEVAVTNLSANRIRDLDVRGVSWKKFYNVNFPPRLPENRGADGLFTAARWEPLASGLLGPVTLTPLTIVR